MGMGKAIGIGCLVILLFIIFGLSCTRSCFFRRRPRYYMRHVSLRVAPVRPVTYIHDKGNMKTIDVLHLIPDQFL